MLRNERRGVRPQHSILLQNPRFRNPENLWKTVSGVVDVGNNLKIFLKVKKNHLQSLSGGMKVIS